MLIVFDTQAPLAEVLAARGRLPSPRPQRCPQCGPAPMAFAGWWTKLTRYGPVDIHRVACGRCGATHSLWPDVLVGRRADSSELIGAALTAAADGVGHRRIAAHLRLPAATVRGWLRAFRRIAATICQRLLRLAFAADPAASWPRARGHLQMAVEAAVTAAGALRRLGGEPVHPWRLTVHVVAGRLLG